MKLKYRLSVKGHYLLAAMPLGCAESLRLSGSSYSNIKRGYASPKKKEKPYGKAQPFRTAKRHSR